MSVLTKGRTELSCYNNIGGIKNVYFFKYVDYAYNQIIGTKGVELTTFPSTTIYKYEVQSGSFNENIQNDDNGELYQQNCSFTLVQQNLLTTLELDLLTKIDLRYIVEFNDGSFKIGGLYNGAKITSLDLASGGTKADFNGYNITIASSEVYGAAFIDDLEDVGFVIDNQIYSYQFQNDNNFVFQDLNNFIFN